MSVFGRLINGEIPCHKLYEDELVFAFLDISPLSLGHALVIPKEEAATIDELSDDSAAAIGRVLPRLSRALKKLTEIQDFNILQNNGELAHQAVFHVHFHIIPKPNSNAGLGITWPVTKLDNNVAADLAARVRKELEAK